MGSEQSRGILGWIVLVGEVVVDVDVVGLVVLRRHLGSWSMRSRRESAWAKWGGFYTWLEEAAKQITGISW